MRRAVSSGQPALISRRMSPRSTPAPASRHTSAGGNPKAVNPAGYYGLYQFSPATWRSVGGSGMPHHASPSEQLYRAKVLYKKAGAGQWGCGGHLHD